MTHKIAPEKQIEVNKDVLTEILQQYAISDFTFEPIRQGIENSSVRIQTGNRKFVLRIYAQGRKKDVEIKLELAFQDYLRERGIPIPAVLQNTFNSELTVIEKATKQWQCILMDFVEGQSKTPHPTPELIKELATLQAKMHLLGIEYAKDIYITKSPWIVLRESHAENITTLPFKDALASDLLERIKSYTYALSPELPHGYNHLDLDFDGNVLTKDNKVRGIIDFDDLEYSPSIVCLGYTLFNILDDVGLDAMQYYLNEYEKVRPLTPIEREVLPHIIFFRNYIIGVMRLLLWDETSEIKDIEDILRLEIEIPALFNTLV